MKLWIYLGKKLTKMSKKINQKIKQDYGQLIHAWNYNGNYNKFSLQHSLILRQYILARLIAIDK